MAMAADTLEQWRQSLRTAGGNLSVSAVSERFGNVQPISDFFDFKRISKPENFGDVQERVNYNLTHFSSNYLALSVMLGIYSLLTNLALLFLILFVFAGLFVIKKLGGRDLEIGSTRLTTSQLYVGMGIIGGVLFLWSSPLTTILWLVGANGVSILGHAAFMEKPAFCEEAV